MGHGGGPGGAGVAGNFRGSVWLEGKEPGQVGKGQAAGMSQSQLWRAVCGHGQSGFVLHGVLDGVRPGCDPVGHQSVKLRWEQEGGRRLLRGPPRGLS